MRRRLMAEQWDQFARAVFTPDISKVQRQEMRRAFYAGAQSILFRIIAVLAPESDTTEEDMRMMQDLEDELQDFAEAVKSGRA